MKAKGGLAAMFAAQTVKAASKTSSAPATASAGKVCVMLSQDADAYSFGMYLNLIVSFLCFRAMVQAKLVEFPTSSAKLTKRNKQRRRL